MIPFGAVLKKSPYSAVRAQPPEALHYHQDPDTKFPTRLDVKSACVCGHHTANFVPTGLGVIFDKEVSNRLKSHPHIYIYIYIYGSTFI